MHPDSRKLNIRSMHLTAVAAILCSVSWIGIGSALAEEPQNAAATTALRNIPVNTWVKLSPLASTPPSPRMGYEGACAWDARHRLLIRYGGHNQGGGGEQGSEIWTFEPVSARWTLMLPNLSPPGICCGQQNIFDPISGRYVRFPAFSASHGWQWRREVYLNDSSVWTYDLTDNLWRNLRPLPTVNPRPLRCAAWDAEHQVIVMFGGEGSGDGTVVYDPYENRWTRMKPPVEPEPRSGGNLAYDPVHRLHVLFGSQFNNDLHTWGYDLRTNTWRDLKPPSLPPTDKNDAVLAYDAAAGKIVAVVKITTGEDDKVVKATTSKDEKPVVHRLETWTYDTGENRWTKLDPQPEPDPTSSRARQLVFAPELGVSLLENRPSTDKLREQQIWAYRLPPRAGGETGPASPVNVQVTVGDGTAALTWRRGDGAASYAIYRGTGDVPWRVDYQKLATVDGKTEKYEDRGLARGTIYHYFVRAVDAAGREGAASLKVRTQPRVVEEVAVSVPDARRVSLAWSAPAGAEGAGYLVERAVVDVLTDDQLKQLKKQTPPLGELSVGAIRRIGPFIKPPTAASLGQRIEVDDVDLEKPVAIEGEPSYERSFGTDQLDPAGRPYRFGVYAYRVRAVNALGIAGGASAAVLTIPSSPQNVFAKEVGTTCHIRWQANRENSGRYRVYRMDGRYDSDSVTRLTPEPITETRFTDTAAGTKPRRYYVVAVDALGQEGFPSSPVWFNREFGPFYVPFVGEWHQ